MAKKTIKQTYRIEILSPTRGWVLLLTWWGLPKGKAEGIMLALDSFYGTEKTRMIRESDGAIMQEAGGRSLPSVR